MTLIVEGLRVETPHALDMGDDAVLTAMERQFRPPIEEVAPAVGAMLLSPAQRALLRNVEPPIPYTLRDVAPEVVVDAWTVQKKSRIEPGVPFTLRD